MKDRTNDFYKALRERIRNWLSKKGKHYRYADLLLFAPDLFHLLSRLTLDDRIPLRYKAQLGAAIAYFVSPMDLIPEAVLGPVANIDDIVISAYVLSRLINAGHGKIAEEHWAGEKNLLEVVRGILDIADQAIGKGLWSRVKDIVDPGNSS
jgi:uncharacterized membrane protein YkvA (DUF1232 family)